MTLTGKRTMARRAPWIVQWSQYLAARMAAAALTSFDVESNLRTASAMGRWLYRVDGRHRRRAAGHLKLAFPELCSSQRRELCERSFEHFVQLVVEICHTQRLIHLDSWASRTRLLNLGSSVRLLNSGKPLIFVTGHAGNWEVLGYIMALLGYPVYALFRPLDNEPLNRWLVEIRQRKGLHLVTKWNATQRMHDILRDGGALGFIADQNAGDKGVFVPFFGRLASTYKSIGLLAIREQVPIVCGYGHRMAEDFRFELGAEDIIRPEDWANRDDPLYYVTARYMRAIENIVRRRPYQYLWMHRRWKSRPRHERAGQPMPTSLRRSLEELPWMDDRMLRRLQMPVPQNLEP